MTDRSLTDLVERQLQVAALSGEVAAVMQGIVDGLMELPGADGACLSTIEGATAHFTVTAGEDRALQDVKMPLADTLGPYMLERGDVTVLRATAGPEVARCLTPGAGAIVLAPLDYDGATRGILGVRSADPTAFQENAVEAAGMLARSASIALRNAELVERLGESERHYRDLHAQVSSELGRLNEIVRTQQEIAALELDLAAVTKAIVERVQRLTGADGVSVQWFDGTDSPFEITTGISAGHAGASLERAGSLSGLVLETGLHAYSADTEDDPRVDVESCRRIGARSLLCAPLSREGVVAGVLAVVSARPDAFDEHDIETGRLMAEFVSSVFRNSTELDTRRRLVERLRARDQVVEHMQTALWVWRLDGDGAFRLEYANAASRSATTLDPSAILGQTLEEVLPNVAERVPGMFREVIEGDKLVDAGEVEYGDERIPPSVFSMKTFPLSERRVAVTFENVTAMVRARRALQESESRFRGAFHSSSVGMALTSLTGSFVQVNERLAELLGYTTEELMRIGVVGITEPADLEIDRALAAELIAGTRDSFQRNKRYVRKNGSTVWAELTASVVRTYDGAATHVVSHVQDITERMEANMLFAATFERTVVPMLVADDDRRIVDINSAGLQLLGVEHDDALGLSIDVLLPDSPVTEDWAAFRAEGTLAAEATMRRPDGARRRIEFTATADIRPGRHIAVVRDLSHQKELESQLRQAQKMEAVGRLAGGIAHDFNNLLTAITGYSEFLVSGLDDPRLKRHAEEITKASSRAASLTGQLLAFSRRQVLQPRVLDLNAVVSDMESMLRRLIGEDVELATRLDPQIAHVLADPTQIEQVIVNLTVNAREAMPSGGSVSIETANSATDRGTFVELRLTDTGTGMTEDQRLQLFEPFFTTKDGGTGLGLATVYGIVEQSGGTIEVDSAPGMGSTFRILLPRVEGPATNPAPPPTREAPAGGSETILLVEDENVVRRLVAEILETAGYNVLQAGDGPSALELLRRQVGPIDLLVTDVVMPGMSGPEVAQAVVAMRPGTQVLYTSGYTDSAIGHHGVLEPGIAFLQKPFSADELARKVRALLDIAAAAPVD
ncbi:MAG TPA: PAS domain S-box protein [Gaiellaceae bacterium]